MWFTKKEPKHEPIHPYGDLYYVSPQFFYIKSLDGFCKFADISSITVANSNENNRTVRICWVNDEVTILRSTTMKQVGDFLAFYKV